MTGQGWFTSKWKQLFTSALALTVFLMVTGQVGAAQRALVVDNGTGGFKTIDFAKEPPEISQLFVAGMLGNNLDVVVTPDKKYALVSDFGGQKIHRIDMSDPKNPVQAGSLSTSPINAEDIALSPDGKVAVVSDGSLSSPVILIDMATFTVKAVVSMPYSGYMATSVAIAPDNKTVLVGDYQNKRVNLFSISADRSTMNYTGAVTSLPVYPVNIAVSSQGIAMVVGVPIDVTKNIVSLRIIDGSAVLEEFFTVDFFVQSAVFSADGSKCYIVSTEKKVTELLIGTSGQLSLGRIASLSVAPIGYFGVESLAISPDGRYLVVSNSAQAYGGQSVSVVNVDTFAAANIYAGIDKPAGVAFMPSILPTITGDPATTATVGQTYAFTPTVTGATLVYAHNLPDWLSLDPATGTISGTPTSGGAYPDITIIAENEDGPSQLAPFTISVTRPNTAPEFKFPAFSFAYVGEVFTVTPSVIDAEGDSVTFSASNLPAWASIDAVTGTIAGTPASKDVGKYGGIAITCTDSYGAATSVIELSITVPNRTPTLSGVPGANLFVGNQYEFVPIALDADKDQLTFSIVNMPPWANFDSTTGVLRGSAKPNNVGRYPGIVIKVSDGRDSAEIGPFTITVPNRAPVISGVPSTVVLSGKAFKFQPVAEDADGQVLTFSIENKPAWATFESKTGALVGVPASDQIGEYSNVVIKVTDGYDTTQLAPFTISVPNQKPVLTGTAPASVMAGDLYSFVPIASDADGHKLSFSASNLPAWAKLDPATGILSGIPSSAQVAVYPNITIAAFDGYETSTLAPFSINVIPGLVTLGTPSNISVPSSNITGSFYVSWGGSSVSGVTYKLEQSVNGGAYSEIYSGTSGQYMVSSLLSGNYSYRVKAVKTGYKDSGYQTAANNCNVALALTTPINISAPASNSTGSYYVSWGGSNVSGVTFKLEQSLNDGAFVEIYSGTSGQYMVSSLLSGNYNYRVKATKANYQESDYRSTASSTKVALALTTPTTITAPATNSTGSYYVSWGGSNVSGVTFKLEQSLNDGAFVEIYSGTSGQYMVSSLLSGNYNYRVKATKTNYQESGYATTSTNTVVALALTAPNTISAPTTNSTGSYYVSWGGSNVSGVTFKLEQSANGGAFAEIYSGSSGQYMVSVPASGSFSYRVKATKANYQESGYTTTSANTVVALALTAPNTISAPATNNTGSYYVSWGGSNVSGVTFKLEQSVNGGAFSEIYSGTSGQYMVSVPASDSFSYRVKATKANYQESGYTTTSANTVVALALTAPNAISAPTTNSTGSYYVSWGGSNVSGVTFKLEQSANGGAYAEIYSGTSGQYMVTVPASGSFSYRVKATKANYQESGYTTTSANTVVALALTAPNAISAPTTNSTGGYYVSWSGSNVSGVTYKLEQSTNGAPFVQIYSGTASQYMVSSQLSGNYSYRVKATKANYQESGYATTVDDTVVALALTPPTTITAPATNSTGAFYVSWGGSNVTGVTYLLEVSANNGEFVEIYRGPSQSFLYGTTQTGSYSYRVKAIKLNYQDSGYSTTTAPCVVI